MSKWEKGIRALEQGEQEKVATDPGVIECMGHS